MTMKSLLPTVTLRALEPEDLDMLYHIENDQKLWNIGATNVPYSRYALHDYIAHASADIYTDKQVRLIRENGEGKAVGLADIVNFDPKHCRAELGIIIATPFRRMGYAQAAVAWVTRYAFSQLHLHQLYVVIAADNEPSLSLFRKAGFEQTLSLRHWLFDGSAYHDAVLMQLLSSAV